MCVGLFEMSYPHFPWHLYVCNKKSQNSDTLGPVELVVWTEQSNQGDWREQRQRPPQNVPAQTVSWPYDSTS